KQIRNRMDPFISFSPHSIAASGIHALLLPGCLLLSATLALESLSASHRAQDAHHARKNVRNSSARS
ncbi:hypothetical protein A4X03_0g9401, partial [Tilletia caries]